MKRLALLLVFLSLSKVLFASPFHSENEEIQMGRESHGGDRIGLEFIASAKAGIKALSEMKIQVAVGDLEKILENALIASTDDDLLIDRNNNRQTSTAINFYDEQNRPVIRVNSLKWAALSVDNKRALAVHELLCLLGIEKTYDYRVSSNLSSELLDQQLSADGFICDRDLLNKLTKKQLEQLLGDYQYEHHSIFLKIFIDYRSNNVKYLHELKNTMIGTYTTSETLSFCKKMGSANLYLPIAGGLVTFDSGADLLYVELNGVGNDGPTQNFNRVLNK